MCIIGHFYSIFTMSRRRSINQRSAKTKKPSMLTNSWLSCTASCRIKANGLLGITDISSMWRRENGQKVDADDTIPSILWLERADKSH